MKYAKIELHLHLDGSIDLVWGYKTALKRKVIDDKTTFEQYYSMMYKNDYPTREERMKKFDFPCAVMQEKEDLSDSVYYLAKRLNELGLLYAEVRFAPQQHTLSGCTQKEAILAVVEGIKRAERDFPDLTIKLINCLMHKGKDADVNMKENMETVEATKETLGKYVVALDLAGYENTGDFMKYAPLFEKAREYGIPYTIHAGEMGDGSHVLDALKMKAYRIGHGINCVDHPDWLKAMVESQIPMEVCVSSNCGDVRNYAAHPIMKMLEAGCNITLNSDNMMFSRTNILNEHAQLRSIGVTEEQLRQCMMNAVNAAFCDEETKIQLRKKLGIEGF